MTEPLSTPDITPPDATPDATVARRFFLSGRLFILIAVVNVAIYLWQLFDGIHWLEPDLIAMIGWGANVAPLSLDGEPWRLFTSMFLHSGAIHLAANMYMLMLCGLLVERTFGTWSFGAIYLVSGLAGSMLSAWWAATNTVTGMQYVGGMLIQVEHLRLVVSVGASGALMGLAGAFVAHRLISGPEIGEQAEDKTHHGIWQIIGINVVMGAINPAIDQACHVGGLIAGAALGAGFALVNEQAPTIAKALIRGGMALIALLLVGSVLLNDPSTELREQRVQLLAEIEDAAKEKAQDVERIQLEETAALEAANAPPSVDAQVAAGHVIDIGMAPEAMVLNRDGTRLYVTSNDNNALLVIDLAEHRIINTIDGGEFKKDNSGCSDNYCRGRGATAVALSPDERYAYVASMREDAVAVIDLQTSKVIESIPVGRFPRVVAVSSDGTRGYVLNSVDNTVSFLNLTTNKPIGKAVALKGGSAEGYPFGRVVAMWLSGDDKMLYVHNGVGHRFESIDTQSKQVEIVVETPSGMIGGAFDDAAKSLYTRAGDRIDAFSIVQQQTTTMPLCNTIESFDIAISPDSAFLAIADKQKLVHVISLATYKTVGLFPTGNWPSQMLFSKDGSKLYVVNASSKSISELALDKSMDVNTVPPLLCGIESPTRY
jgi:rhomboid protease GluP